MNIIVCVKQVPYPYTPASAYCIVGDYKKVLPALTKKNQTISIKIKKERFTHADETLQETWN